MKDKIFYILISILLLAGIYIGLYPVLSDMHSTINQKDVILSYNKDIINLSDSAIAEEFKKCYTYNEKIYNMWKTSIFQYQGAKKTDKEYESLLNTKQTMGYINVPSANITVPIVHGTKDEDLDDNAGHMYLSSLPVGGKNTKAIIAAHTGLPSAKLFSDLNKVKVGEYFYVHVLNKTLCYKIVEINVCMPEEEFHYLQIEPGRDLCTLYTCTPYGINDHRLIVTGEHIESMDTIDEKNISEDNITTSTDSISLQIKFYVLLFSPIVLYLIIMSTIIIIKKKKNKNKNKNEKKEVIS